MTILTSARLRFEPFDERHPDGLQAMNGDPEVMRWLGGRPDTIDDTRATIARVRGRWAEFGFGWWALLDRASGDVVGAAGLKHLEHDRANPHEIGWRLHRDHWAAAWRTKRRARSCTMLSTASARRRFLRSAIRAMRRPSG